MHAETAFPGALVLDSWPFSQHGTAAQAEALKRTGVDAVAGYLNVINKERVGFLHAVGLRFVALTLAADLLKPDRIVAGIRALGLDALACRGGDVWGDCEGQAIYDLGRKNPASLIDPMNISFRAIQKLGLNAGVYFAPPQPLTSGEMFSRLVCTRYWKGMGSIRDRANLLAEPACGWCIVQGYHGKKDGNGLLYRDLDPSKNGTAWKNTGVLVDPNMVMADFQGRLPTWFAGET